MQELSGCKAPAQAMAQHREGLKSSGDEIRIMHKVERLEKSWEMPLVLKTEEIKELSNYEQ